MRVFKNKWFNRWARNEGITNMDICTAAKQVTTGDVEADLGGYLFKKRVARAGGGKSAGYRTIVGYKKGNTDRVIFLYGFPKNSRSNITEREREALSTAAAAFIAATDKHLADLIAKGSIFELECEKS
jgi:hypothetical protein